MPPEPTDTPTPNAKTMERLRLLRQKAELTLAKDPDDADGLAAQAQYLKLLARYRLDPATLNQDTTRAEEVTVTRYTFSAGEWLSKREDLLSGVCAVFQVPHLLVHANEGDTAAALLTGTPAALDTTIAACQHLMPQMDLAVLRAKAAPGYLEETPAGRQLYVSGALDAWVQEVYNRLRALYSEAQAESDAEAMGKELALYDHAKQAMQEVMDQMQQAQAAQRQLAVPGYHHEEARDIGRAAAATADLGQTATGGSAGPLAVGA